MTRGEIMVELERIRRDVAQQGRLLRLDLEKHDNAMAEIHDRIVKAIGSGH